MQFYAVKNMKIELNCASFEFVALDNLLALGFPTSISATSNHENDWFGINVFLQMKVFNEDSFASILSSYNISYKCSLGKYPASFELIEFLSKSPYISGKCIEAGIEFNLSYPFKNLKRVLDLPNPEILSQLVYLDIIHPSLFNDLNKFHLEKLKKFQDQFFACYFLLLSETETEMNSVDFFEWRNIFSFCIKGDQRERIREIRSPAIIKMLRLEYPEQMNEIIGPEQLESA